MEKIKKNKPVLQHYILPQVLLLLNVFVKDHQMREKHLGPVGRRQEMDYDDSPGKENCCSKVTLLVRSG